MKKLIKINKDGRLNLSRLRPKQEEFVRSTLLHTGIVGGYQSGKSLSASIKVLTTLLQNPGVPIGYYLPTYSLIADMLIPRFKGLFSDIGIRFTVHVKESKIKTDYGEIWMRSMDNPDSIVSYSVGYSIVDEADVVHVNKRLLAMQRIASRNSYKKNTPNSIDYVSTPEGFKFMYDFFEKKANKNKKLIRISTYDNRLNLAVGYMDGLRSLYNDQQLRAYFNGEFVNLTSGSVYTDFDRKDNHSGRMLQANDVIHVGIDFNITNMSATINVIDNNVAYCVEELTKVYDTFSMIELIRTKYPGHKITAYPDASGSSRSTSGKSDIELLQQAGFSFRKPRKNPFVKDRINSMNKRFRDKTYYINTFNCPELTEAIEKQAYDKNGEPDKTTGFDHLCDAAGYFINMISKVSF